MKGISLGTQAWREASYDATVHAANTLALYLVVSGEGLSRHASEFT